MSGCTVEDILPPWMLSCYDLEIHDADACLDMNSGAAALAEGNSSFYVFPEAVISPGTLHICHNMVSEVDQSLEHFSEWLPGFKAIVHFLHTDSLRQRFVGSCLLGTHLEFLKHQVVKLMKPALWRWNGIAGILPRLMNSRHVLQSAWNKERFLNPSGFKSQERADDVLGRIHVDGAGAQESQEDSGKLDLPAFENAVKSPDFWLYSNMLLQLHLLVERTTAWMEGCPCECHRLAAGGKQVDSSSDADALQVACQAARVPVESKLRTARNCPLAGQRSVELASGLD